MGLDAPGRRRRDPAAPGRSWRRWSRRGRGLPRRAGRRPGRDEARDAIERLPRAYGMRCAGEIDITRPRWSERPGALVPVILSNVRNFEPGAARRRFEQGGERPWRRSRTCWGGCGRCRTGSGRPRDQADDRSPADVRRLPRVSEVRDRQPLLRLQAGADGGGRPACGGRGLATPRTSSTYPARSSATSSRTQHWTGAHRGSQGGVPLVSGAQPAAGAHLRGRGLRRVLPTRRCARRRARRPAGFRRDRRGSRPGCARDGERDLHRATSWSPRTRIRAGRRCLSRSPAW